MQLQQGAGSLEARAARSGPAVEIPVEEAAKSGLAKLCPTMQQVKYTDVMKLKVGKSDVWKPDKTHKWLYTTTREQADTFPAWRTSGEDAPVDGCRSRSDAAGRGCWCNISGRGC